MTSTTAEKTEKRPGRPPANPEAEKVDLSALEFEVAEKPKRKGTVDNPFTVPLGESYETETARATKVPAVALSRVEGMLRRAAGELKIGVTIAATEPDKDGKVVVTFMGKDKRKVTRKPKDGETPETPETAETGDAPESAIEEPAPDAGTVGGSDEGASTEREPAAV